MNISNTILQHTDNLYKEINERLDRAVREGASKEYVQILSELVSFISSLRKFLVNASVLDNIHSSVKSGKVCFQWLYTEDGAHISLVKFDPLVTVAYDNARIYVGFNEKGVGIHGNTIEYHINSLKEVVSLNEIGTIIVKKSLVLDTLGTLKTVLQHFMEDFIKCSRTFKVKSI
ncbi:MAG: hypothetical protein N3D82_03805 [Ignisphaera sp.]|nr:hypothetical protein [Ignisphaera sp.]MCX8168132.1 hypothetical protein [Ignisphaera sp.]MDW8085433.1 hypothetical protein [Ignisphaera sp.]